MTVRHGGDQNADLAKRKLIANIRHDLRTPINHVIGYSEMLQEQAEDLGHERFIPDLQRIQASGQELLELITDILDPAKIRADKISLSRLRHELRAPITTIIGYGEMVQEEAEEQGQEELIPDLQRICAAAKGLLGLMNDRLALSDVDSDEAADGLDADGEAGLKPQFSPEGPVAQAQPTVAGTVLVVDDNELNRDLLSRRLNRQGHSVAVAVNGLQALEMVRANNFDLVLLDVMMPEMDGFQVLEHLKADDSLRHVPVIMLSALDEMESVVRCIEIGAEDFLPRPYSPVLLNARVGACLEKKRLRDQEVFYLQQIEQEKQRADDLLHVILPEEIVGELKATNMVRPKRYEAVAVLFCDIMGFTAYCDGRQPEEVIPGLQRLVEAYEDLASRYDLQKIKTIGDSFMAAAGLLNAVENPVLNCVTCGLDMIVAARDTPANWQVRVGVHVGPVVAGVVGHRQYLFDLWGDTVNTASRLEAYGEPGAVNLSRAAWEHISHQSFGESLGMVQVKGKGDLEIIQFKGFRKP